MRQHVGDEERLPKWAQDKLRVLRMRLDEANRRMAEEHGEMDGPVVFTKIWTDMPRPVARENEVVEFHIGDDKLYIKVTERSQEPVVEIMAYNARLSVEPQSTNVMLMRVRP
jgi:hypothetical protein